MAQKISIGETFLVLLHGCPGAGKSTAAEALSITFPDILVACAPTGSAAANLVINRKGSLTAHGLFEIRLPDGDIKGKSVKETGMSICRVCNFISKTMIR